MTYQKRATVASRWQSRLNRQLCSAELRWRAKMGRLSFERAMEKKRARRAAEAAREVADSHSVRLEILARVKRGEITLAQGQAELKQIQAKAQSIGLKTRTQTFNEG